MMKYLLISTFIALVSGQGFSPDIFRNLWNNQNIKGAEKIEQRVAFLEKIVYKGLSKDVAEECGLGVQNKIRVADSQLSCGSYFHNAEWHSAKAGRLFGPDVW